jgi:hypothetical protein
MLEDRQMRRTYVVEPAGDQIPLDSIANRLPADPKQRSEQRPVVSGS